MIVLNSIETASFGEASRSTIFCNRWPATSPGSRGEGLLVRGTARAPHASHRPGPCRRSENRASPWGRGVPRRQRLTPSSARRADPGSADPRHAGRDRRSRAQGRACRSGSGWCCHSMRPTACGPAEASALRRTEARRRAAGCRGRRARHERPASGGRHPATPVRARGAHGRRHHQAMGGEAAGDLRHLAIGLPVGASTAHSVTTEILHVGP